MCIRIFLNRLVKDFEDKIVAVAVAEHMNDFYAVIQKGIQQVG
jgi:hypothetical protein